VIVGRENGFDDAKFTVIGVDVGVLELKSIKYGSFLLERKSLIVLLSSYV
jgi:hypothetical protein